MKSGVYILFFTLLQNQNKNFQKFDITKQKEIEFFVSKMLIFLNKFLLLDKIEKAKKGGF